MVYARTTDVCTRCRLCGERTPPESRVIRVHSPHTSRIAQRYYCLYCWDYLVERASAEIPDLVQRTDEQAAQHIGMLLGIRTAPVDYPNRPMAERLHLDMAIKFPTSLLEGRVPFERWYPKGEELDAHILEAKKRMGHDG